MNTFPGGGSMEDNSGAAGDRTIRHGQAADGRRAYSSPKLIEYGSVSKLTRGTMTKQGDAPTGGFRMTEMCL
jgi:hypothetical protein